MRNFELYTNYINDSIILCIGRVTFLGYLKYIESKNDKIDVQRLSIE